MKEVMTVQSPTINVEIWDVIIFLKVFRDPAERMYRETLGKSLKPSVREKYLHAYVSFLHGRLAFEEHLSLLADLTSVMLREDFIHALITIVDFCKIDGLHHESRNVAVFTLNEYACAIGGRK